MILIGAKDTNAIREFPRERQPLPDKYNTNCMKKAG